MMDFKIALIGLGAIGIPVAHKLQRYYPDDFYIILNERRRKAFEETKTFINDCEFNPRVISSKDELKQDLDLLIVCVKNYDLTYAFDDVRNIISKKTIILPLQNGVYSYSFFKDRLPENAILEGYVQGPNTVRENRNYHYENSGALHIGSSNEKYRNIVNTVYEVLKEAGVNVYMEEDIRYMVWKKWMLNVAGNSVTALTGADYSLFQYLPEIQTICINAMREFLEIARAEQVQMSEDDVKDIIKYYVSYNGKKKTSMLMDVINGRKTENDYLAGMALEMGRKHGLKLPIIETLYYLLRSKESVYMEKKGCITMNYLFRQGVEYSESLRAAMQDINDKMESREFAKSVNAGNPVELQNILTWAIDNTQFYSNINKEDVKITDFPVMNKTLLNEHYNEFVVAGFNDQNTHKMHTSGSTGIPFTVLQDLKKRERHIADLKYFGAMAGYLDHDPMCYLRAKPTATSKDQERDNIWQLDICNLSEENLTEYFHIMVEKKCTALIAYPSTLETAVDFWAKTFSNESSIKTIISTSESLTDEVKNKLRNFFGNQVNVYARYSNTENGILGQETGESNVFTLNWASYYFEILKLDSDEPASNGELGRIIVTDLYNKAFPMIRYDTGDVARMNKGADDELPKFSELYGRRMDLIYDTRGKVVSPFLLCRTMRLSKGIEQWQFIQESETEYTLKITSNLNTRPRLDKEVESFKQTLGQAAVIHVVYVEDIPVMSSLKRKLIVSNIKK